MKIAASLVDANDMGSSLRRIETDRESASRVSARNEKRHMTKHPATSFSIASNSTLSYIYYHHQLCQAKASTLSPFSRQSYVSSIAALIAHRNNNNKKLDQLAFIATAHTTTMTFLRSRRSAILPSIVVLLIMLTMTVFVVDLLASGVLVAANEVRHVRINRYTQSMIRLFTRLTFLTL
jgi:hypothetical protein